LQWQSEVVLQLVTHLVGALRLVTEYQWELKQARLAEVQIRSSAMNISLEGSYTFDGTLDYTLGFSMRDLRHRGNGEFGPIEDDGLGQQFFIQMNGNVNSPDYSWDRKAQRNHRKNNFQREKELLKSLFKRS
jgi:hypothetical protein